METEKPKPKNFESNIISKKWNWSNGLENIKNSNNEETNKAKFIKSYSFFDGNLSPFLNAYITIPSSSAFIQSKGTSEKAKKEGMNISTQKDRVVRLSNPPYNIIKSFSYDVLETSVELEFFDGGGTLLNILLSQFQNIESAIGTLTLSVRYGWANPTYPIRNSLIDNVTNIKPKQKNEARVRFTNYITFIVNDIELEFTTSGVNFKMKGINNATTRIIPTMEYFNPYRIFGPYPLIEFGALTQLEELKANLEENQKILKQNDALEKTVSNWLESIGFTTPSTNTNKFFSLMINVIRRFNNYEKIKNGFPKGILDKDKTKRLEAIKNVNDTKKNIVDLYLYLEQIVEEEEKKEFNQNNLFNAREIVNSILLNAKGSFVNSFEALTYVIYNMRYHIEKIEVKNRICIVPFIFLDKETLKEDSKETKKLSEDSKNEIPKNIPNLIPIKNLLISNTTSYDELLKSISSYMKITKKDEQGKIFLKYVDYRAFIAFGADEIILKMDQLNELILQKEERDKESGERIRKNITNAVIENLKNIVNVQLKTSLPEIIKQLKDGKTTIFYSQTPIVIFFIFSEYDTTSFFTTTERENLIHGYSYRPGGFRVGLQVKESFGQSTDTLKTKLPNTMIDKNYFNTGTLKIEDNNFPDVLSFTPKVEYNLIRSAMNKFVNGSYVDFPSMIYSDNKSTKNQTSNETPKTREDKILDDIEKLNEQQNIFQQLKSIRDAHAILQYHESVILPNANIISENNSVNALRLRLISESYREALSALLVGYEAELKILGEPYLDITQINKFIDLKIYAPNGDNTFYTGIYRISGISHSIEDGKFETNLKIYRTNIDKITFADSAKDFNGSSVYTKPSNTKGVLNNTQQLENKNNNLGSASIPIINSDKGLYGSGKLTPLQEIKQSRRKFFQKVGEAAEDVLNLIPRVF